MLPVGALRYEPEFDLDTFYAKPGDALYEKLKDIMMIIHRHLMMVML